MVTGSSVYLALGSGCSIHMETSVMAPILPVYITRMITSSVPPILGTGHLHKPSDAAGTKPTAGFIHTQLQQYTAQGGSSPTLREMRM